ncbi:MAG TPA: alpha/beta fold hydrolase [Steroidobacteraceae bacterium]
MKTNRRQFLAASTAGALGVAAWQLPAAALSEGSRTFHRQVGVIRWYCELRGRGPAIVLIPSGEGDCGSFEKVAITLASEFTVLSIDMPGFSRSSDPPNFDHYSISQGAAEIAALVRALGLTPATFYGCSSGGQFALRLAAEHPEVVRKVIVHEVAPAMPALSFPAQATDEAIIHACREMFRNLLNENAAAWDALPPEFHHRLDRNYVTWVRRYLPIPDMRMPTPQELRQRPVTWTIGGLTPAVGFFNNVQAAFAGGIQIGLLMCKHFPQVSIPDALAHHIAVAARA